MKPKTLSREYHELVARLVSGESPDDDAVRDILAAAGKTPSDLQADVKRLGYITFDTVEHAT